MNKGDRVRATKDIPAGIFSGGDLIREGTRGVVTGTSWGSGQVTVSWTLNGFLGERQAQRDVDASQIAKA